MLLRLTALEWRNLSGDRSALAVGLLLGLAVSYGAFNGSRWVAFQKSAIDAALHEERTRMEAIRAEMPRIASGEKKVSAYYDSTLPQSFGRNMGLRYAVMPPAPLGVLAIGQSDLYPYYFKVSTYSKQTFLNNDEIENPSHLHAGRFDLAFVILYLFPLVILGFSYNIVSAEKEGGTLALALSQPVSLPGLVLSRLLLRAAFVVAVAVLLSIAAVAVVGADVTSGESWMRLAFWIGVCSAYGGFWFALALAVNARGKGSSVNAISLAGLWLLFVIVIPSVLNVVVKGAYPVPSRVELIQAIRVAGEEATRQSSQLLARYMEDHPEMAPVKDSGDAPDYGTLLVAVTDATERSVQPVLDEFDRQLQAQQNLVDRLRYLSPTILAQSGLNDLAGSSPHRYRHFLAQVEDYHREWRGFFVPRILRKEKLTPSDIGKLPSFQFREEDPATVFARVALPLGCLGIVAGLIGLASLAALRRYPIAG